MAWSSVQTDQAQSHYSYYDNAKEIWDYAINAGCTEQAAAGLLGNIEAESYCNPGQFEIGKNKSLRWGMGLIQWTPTQSYWDQYQTNPIVAELGSSWYSGPRQMQFIFGGDVVSWIPTMAYNYSFEHWKLVNNINEATRAYYANRERGTWSDDRLTYAQHWYDEFSGSPVPPTPTGKFRPELAIWLLAKIAENNRIV